MSVTTRSFGSYAASLLSWYQLLCRLFCLCLTLPCRPQRGHADWPCTCPVASLQHLSHWCVQRSHRRTVCCAGEKDYSHEPWRTHTLRVTPQFMCLVSGNLADDRNSAYHGEFPTFTVPASVETLHLLTSPKRSEVRYRPILTGTTLRELHIDLDSWDAAVVRVLHRQLWF